MPVTVTGVGFFDFLHGQTGVAPNGIELHAVLDIQFGTGSGGNTVTVTNPGSRTGTVGTALNLQIQASDSAAGQTLTYSAAGLPAGLSINSGTGLISGTPTTAGSSTVTVTASDTTGAKGSATFTWTINPSERLHRRRAVARQPRLRDRNLVTVERLAAALSTTAPANPRTPAPGTPGWTGTARPTPTPSPRR